MQRGESQELVDALTGSVQRSTDLLAMRGAAVLRDELEVVYEPWPAGETVAASDHHLRIGKCLHRMKLGGQGDGFGICGADLLEQGLGLLLQVVKTRRSGKVPGRHSDLLSACLLSASSGEKGGGSYELNLKIRWAKPFPRTGGTLSAWARSYVVSPLPASTRP